MKHAEILEAIAQGKEIQYQNLRSQEWRDVTKPEVHNPLANPKWTYRVKPVFKYTYTIRGQYYKSRKLESAFKNITYFVENGEEVLIKKLPDDE